jgi:hypothetical protein
MDKKIVNVGDTIQSIADDFGLDWRELADIYDLDVMNNLNIGSVINKPNVDLIKEKYETIVTGTKELVNQITNNRDIKTIVNLLGVNDKTIIEQLDLSVLAVNKVESYQIIDWLL